MIRYETIKIEIILLKNLLPIRIGVEDFYLVLLFALNEFCFKMTINLFVVTIKISTAVEAALETINV